MASSQTLADWVRDLPKPAVACTLVEVVGSAPQSVGARMWVGAERFLGTLGGGEFERRVLDHARRMLREGRQAPALMEFVLCKEMGQCCGGRARVFFEPVLPKKSAVLFGAGHVGRAVAEVLAGTPADVLLVDGRPEWAKAEDLPSGVESRLEDPLAYARSRRWGERDACCVFTHSHELDFQLVSFLLPQPLGFLGLIGSEHKAAVFRARLGSGPDGSELQALWDEKMHCPLGIPLDSKNPKVIAVSIAAELLREWGLREPEAPELHGAAR